MNDAAIDPPDLDDEPPVPCPVCTGHDDAEPCSEHCEYLVMRFALVQQAKAYRVAAKMCLRMAHRYAAEERHGNREVACRIEAREYLSRARMTVGAIASLSRAYLETDAELAHAAE